MKELKFLTKAEKVELKKMEKAEKLELEKMEDKRLKVVALKLKETEEVAVLKE